MSSTYWLSTSTNAKPLTAEDLQRAMVAIHERHVAHTEAETSAYTNFLNSVPERFRDHPEILTMAAIVAASQSYPIHPKDRDRLMERYKEIVHD